MKAFVACPHGVNFDTFFTPENIALADSLGGGGVCAAYTADRIALVAADADHFDGVHSSPSIFL